MKLSNENDNNINNDLEKGVLLETKPKTKTREIILTKGDVFFFNLIYLIAVWPLYFLNQFLEFDSNNFLPKISYSFQCSTEQDFHKQEYSRGQNQLLSISFLQLD